MSLPYNIPLSHGLPRIAGCLLVVLLLSVASLVVADEVQTTEYRVKTAFLYNFSRFVTWPQAALLDHTEFSFCVIGKDPFGTQLDKLTAKTVHDKSLVVTRLSSLAMIDHCNLLYIGENTELGDVLLLLREKPVLTVSDTADFVEQGGIIQFVLVDNKVGFRINVDAANTAGLSISSKLLSLAIGVTGGD